MHQNVNKQKSRAARTVYGAIFLPFYMIIGSFSCLFCQDAKKTGSNCAIIGCNLSKKQKFALYKTQRGDPNYVDYKFFVILCLTLRNILQFGDRHTNTIELASWLVHVLCDFKTNMTSRSFSLP